MEREITHDGVTVVLEVLSWSSSVKGEVSVKEWCTSDHHVEVTNIHDLIFKNLSFLISTMNTVKGSNSSEKSIIIETLSFELSIK